MAEVLVQEPAGVLAVLLAVLAVIFYSASHPTLGRPFKVVPPIVFCYFVPTFLTWLKIIPQGSELYAWVKTFVLPASLLLLTLALDVKELIKLGPKAIIMMLAGTAGVVVGGPISLLLCKHWLPADAWQGMSALAGSWIGGAANMIAIGQAVGATDSIIGPIVVVDTVVGAVWMGVLVYLSGLEAQWDARLGADNRAIRRLETKMADFRAAVARIATMPELMIIVALAFVFSWISYAAGQALPEVGDFVDHGTWKIIVITTIGVALSFTPVRRLEGAGASKIGTVMIYLLVACIGASADLEQIGEYPMFLVMGLVWMSIHVAFMLTVGRLIRSPLFFLAVGSQANIGGAASAPVVAAAFHPALAPVGVLLGIAGYVLGTYAGLACAYLLRFAA